MQNIWGMGDNGNNGKGGRGSCGCGGVWCIGWWEVDLESLLLEGLNK